MNLLTSHPILVVEDEEDILELIAINLLQEDYQVIKSTSGEQALNILKKKELSLAILDLMLPGINGLEILKIIRAEKKIKELPVIIATAKGSEDDIVRGLSLGADDYLVKPFSINILISRVRAVLRRASGGLPDKTKPLNVHGLFIDPVKYIVETNSKRIDLTLSEFAILQMMALRPGWAFTRMQIVDSLRGPDYAVTERSVDVIIVGLRKKLGEFGGIIETVRGIGYRIKE